MFIIDFAGGVGFFFQIQFFFGNFLGMFVLDLTGRVGFFFVPIEHFLGEIFFGNFSFQHHITSFPIPSYQKILPTSKNPYLQKKPSPQT